MKSLIASAVVLAAVLQSPNDDPARFLPRGEVYEDARGEHRLTIRSWSRVLLAEGDEVARGTYERLVDGTIQVQLQTPTGPRSVYYERMAEGLQAIEPSGAPGRLLYDRDHLAQGLEQSDRQKRTVAQIEKVGAAWSAWLADQLSAAATGSNGSSTRTYDITSLTDILTGDDLLQTLFPEYIQHVPVFDGWGNDIEYLHSTDIHAPQFMAIRSPGRDGAFEATVYPIKPFAQHQWDRDIVWADGFWVRRPKRQQP